MSERIVSSPPIKLFPIESAPLDGTVVDLWAKTWDSKTDQFIVRRFAGYRWAKNIEVADSGIGRRLEGDGWVMDALAMNSLVKPFGLLLFHYRPFAWSRVPPAPDPEDFK